MNLILDALDKLVLILESNGKAKYDEIDLPLFEFRISDLKDSLKRLRNLQEGKK